MDLRINSINRMMPPQFTAGNLGASTAGNVQKGWSTHAVGSAELAKVAGEEAIDDNELRRDDPLGELVTRAFSGESAQQALPKLFD